MPSIHERMENTNSLCYQSFVCVTIGLPISQQKCDVIQQIKWTLQKPARKVSRQVQSKVIAGSGPHNKDSLGWQPQPVRCGCAVALPGPHTDSRLGEAGNAWISSEILQDFGTTMLKIVLGTCTTFWKPYPCAIQTGKIFAELWIPVRINNPKIT